MWRVWILASLKPNFSVASHVWDENPESSGFRTRAGAGATGKTGATQATYATIIVKNGRTIAAEQRLHTYRTYRTLHC
jgi:hypothetical protein